METKLSDESRSEFFCLPLVGFSIKYPTKQTARVKQKTPPHLLRFINLPIIFIQLYLSVARRPLQHFDLVTIQGETIKYCVF